VAGLDHDSGEPLYLQLADLLRRQIQRGELTSRVPSVKTLSQDHDVSHVTAEKALAVLRDEGLIRSVIGKGFYVVKQG
jgi:GntR family transcriptional regulator